MGEKEKTKIKRSTVLANDARKKNGQGVHERRSLARGKTNEINVAGSLSRYYLQRRRGRFCEGRRLGMSSAKKKREPTPESAEKRKKKNDRASHARK